MEVKVIKVPQLPAAVETLKSKGNELFKAGQYGEALGYYTQAISRIDGDSTMEYHQATILSNRSACHIKSGDCRAAIQDCTAALQLTPNNAKALLRRATAQETLERYTDAYVDYRHVINIDPNAHTAYAGANRCEKMLSNEHGNKWRATVPKIPSSSDLTTYEVEGVAKPPAPQRNAAPINTAQVPPAQLHVKDPPKAEPLVESNEDKFNRLKETGNKNVGKGDYDQAKQYYTEAIDLYPDRVVPYSNRALCHLKTNQPALAVKDCDTVLAIEPGHIKALFRKAQANKMMEKYKESLMGLTSLLKLDPNNSAAKKEIETVKAAYKTQLESLQTKAPATPSSASSKQTTTQSSPQTAKKHESKPATRVVIEECSDSDSEQVTPTSTTNTATSNSTTDASSAAQTSSKSKSRQKKKKQAAKKAAAAKNNQSQPGTATVVPTLSANPTAYEFTQAWTSMKNVKETEPFAQLLKQIPPARLASVLSNKLEAEMLEKIIACLDNHFTTGELNDVESYLKSLSSVPRFSMITMFMSASCKAALENLFKKLEAVSSHVDKLRIAFSL